jgi:hypothetical protein
LVSDIVELFVFLGISFFYGNKLFRFIFGVLGDGMGYITKALWLFGGDNADWRLITHLCCAYVLFFFYSFRLRFGWMNA